MKIWTVFYLNWFSRWKDQFPPINGNPDTWLIQMRLTTKCVLYINLSFIILQQSFIGCQSSVNPTPDAATKIHVLFLMLRLYSSNLVYSGWWWSVTSHYHVIINHSTRPHKHSYHYPFHMEGPAHIKNYLTPFRQSTLLHTVFQWTLCGTTSQHRKIHVLLLLGKDASKGNPRSTHLLPYVSRNEN